ncbi:hypothetical protein, partial [Candidatus Ichthyocystis hellenicum]|uniref:hypothetical protein n=1 Tax=Candidatus Ichthyocystis hellenicum TaxID=1561003 RepID=UPI001F5E47A4
SLVSLYLIAIITENPHIFLNQGTCERTKPAKIFNNQYVFIDCGDQEAGTEVKMSPGVLV